MRTLGFKSGVEEEKEPRGGFQKTIPDYLVQNSELNMP